MSDTLLRSPSVKIGHLLSHFVLPLRPLFFTTASPTYRISLSNLERLSFYRTYPQILKSQWLTREDLESLQLSKLKETLNYAYENVPYYKKQFEKAGIKPSHVKCYEDLMKVPVLEKEDAILNSASLISKKFRQDKVMYTCTSGTTGKTVKVYYDQKAAVTVYALKQRANEMAGMPSDYKSFAKPYKLVRLGFGASGISPPFYRPEIDVAYYPIFRQLILSTKNISKTHLRKCVTFIRKLKPEYIFSYPTAMYFFAKFLSEEKIHDITFKFAATESETLFPEKRMFIEKQLGCKIFDRYRNREEVGFAAECDKHNGLHLDSEFCIAEVLNKEEQSFNKSGELVLTGLYNRVMPLIRYRIGDLANISKRVCSCGRGLHTINSVEGRAEDVLVTAGGRIVSPVEIAALECRYCDHIEEMQVVQEDLNRIILNVVRGEDFSIKDIRQLSFQLRNLLGKEMKIDIVFLNEVPRTKAGKFRHIISKVSLDY